MARLLPSQVADHTTSNAERRLFSKIRDELSDEWTVLHSLGLASHSTKPWAEIDFVLIGPPGVICLEVKGGRVQRRGGEWLFIDGKGNVNRRREGPFDQVGSASAALYQWLKHNVDGLDTTFVGYAIATPDIVWRVDGPDLPSLLVYDAARADRGLTSFIDDVVEYWKSTTKERFGRTPSTLDAKTRDRLVDALRVDFDLRPSLQARIRNVNDELIRLTNEQYRVLDGLVDSPRAVIRGPAGTGKTLLAIEEALRAIAAGKSVALVCYSKRLGEYLDQATNHRCRFAGHLHGLMADVIKRSGRDGNLPDASENALFSVFYPEEALEGLADLDLLGTIDLLIVDEAQDLLQEAYLDFFDGLLDGGLRNGSWRMFLDPVQNIFDVMHTPAIARILEHRPATFRLTVNCRNTQQIAIQTALLADADLVPILRVDGEPCRIIWYRDVADLRRRLSRYMGRLLSNGVSPHDLVILSPRRLENSSLSDGIPGIPYSLTDRPPSANQPAITYSTIAGFKGLEANVVVLADVDDLLSDQPRSYAYVGTSRARALLAIFLKEAEKPAYEELARRFGSRFATTTSASEVPGL